MVKSQLPREYPERNKLENRSILWSQLVEKLSNTTRTPETVIEYKKMPKTDRDNLKDVGGFVGALLRMGVEKQRR